LRALEAIWELKEGIDASIDLTELYDQIDAGARQVAAELFKPLIERLKRELEKGNNGDRDALYFAVAAVLAMHGLVEQLEKEREYAGRPGDRYRDCILLITGAIKAVPVATYNQETGKVEYRYPEPPAVPLRWF
jgi:maltooligosyltrehalose synthase